MTTWPSIEDERQLVASTDERSASRVRALLHRIRELESRVYDLEFSLESIDDIKRVLAKYPCLHEPGHHGSTPPMMWPELIACIVAKAKQDVQKKACEEWNKLKSESKPLTKARIEEAAEKLFKVGVGLDKTVWSESFLAIVDSANERIANNAEKRSLPDVVHLLCEALGVKE